MNSLHSDALPSVGAMSFSRLDLAFCAFILVFLYLQLFILPGTPVYVENDQLLPISNAMRILDGEVMYRDFFHFAPPGTELYYAAVFSIFGIKFWVVNATVFLLAVGQLAIVFLLSKKILGSVFIYLPTLIYFVVGFRFHGIDGSYRLFSVVLVLAAAAVVMYSRSTKAIVLAGALCGLSSFFVQTRGLLGIGAISLFILWERWNYGLDFRKLIRDWLVAGSTFVVVVIATQFYMAWLGGFDNYYFANVTFLKDHYGSDTLSNTFAYFTDIPNLNQYLQTYGARSGIFRFVRVAGQTIFFYALVPLVYLIYFIYRKMRKVEPSVDRDLMMLSILGTVLFIGASAPTAFRLYHISIPAVIVLVWLLSKLSAAIVPGRVIAFGLLFLGSLYSIQRQTVDHVVLDLPAGSAAFLAVNTAEKYKWLKDETRPGDYIYEAQHATYYFPLHLRNPTPFYLIRDNNYTPAFQVEQLLTALKTNPPRLIAWHGLWSKDAAERAEGDNLAPLWDLIRTRYRFKKEFVERGEFTVNSHRDIEFWELKDDVRFAETRDGQAINP